MAWTLLLPTLMYIRSISCFSRHFAEVSTYLVISSRSLPGHYTLLLKLICRFIPAKDPEAPKDNPGVEISLSYAGKKTGGRSWT